MLHTLAQTAKILVALVMMLSYALIYYVPFDVVWRRLQGRVPAAAHRWAVAGIRLLGCLMTVGIACAIPRLELFMELVGAVCLSVLGLLLPAVLETAWRWGRGPCKLLVCKNAVIVFFALLAMVSGVVYSIKGIVDHL
ncbi:unnamed protein product [Plutella xylostella]|uniref:(diamondback moth) hypothetical protein n=1 Tax=Plutella xylostella TaxID=51655 RepID=A0A8S4G6M2_PLUXY|nr:unnamed protein product [Plutella xylostella]